MNRFLTKKKAKESPTTETFSPDAHARSLTPTLTRKGRKWKKNQPEPKVELDLSSALPSDDNFRTSLLMNGLSARFSMLREQDDPNSKLGKASDDSVLQPKRQSRLHEFGFIGSNLADIAEVSSINDSIRPPFAQRQGSFASGDSYGADDDSVHGSIMSRARPGEGNVLFGGRQKVYKIPVAPSNVGKFPRARGKAVYEDDISLSAFQKLRQKEKEQQQEEEVRRASEEAERTEVDGEKDTSYPASLSSSIYMKRQTSSSTTSQPSITAPSTAATSIASQGANAIPTSGPPKSSQPVTNLERSGTKSRRLYEQGLNEHLYEQQASALTRLNSIQKQRTAMPGRRTPPYLLQNKSASNLHDRFNRPGNQVYQAYQASSPPPSASAYKLTTFDALRESKSSAGSPVMSYPNSPPLSPPPMSDSEDTPLSMSLSPGDRGKATAMGAFNKPKHQFDEEQYLERQRQMLQGADSTSSEQGSPKKQQFMSNVIDEESAWSQSSPAEDQTDLRKPDSANSPTARSGRAKGRDTPMDLTVDTQKTFFSNIGSDSEEEPLVSPLEASLSPQPIEDPLRLPAPITPDEPHPAFRSLSTTAEETHENNSDQRSVFTDAAITPRINQEPTSQEEEHAPLEEIDSPTLGADDAALSGLIRQHLRNGSGQSSIWGDRTPAPSVPPLDAMPRIPPSRMVSRIGTESSYTHSNPWDLDDIDSAYFGEGDSLSSISPIEGPRSRHHPFGSAMPKLHEERSSHSQKEADDVPWQQVLKNKHSRGGSTETQQEREAFANELAQRQKAIQENMKTRAESESRAPSPSYGGDRLRVFGKLRNKSSRESIVSRAEPSAKALKRLGISVNDGSTTSLIRNQTRRSQASGSDDRDDGSVKERRMPINTQKSVDDMRRKWEAHLERQHGHSRANSPHRATTYSQSSYGASIRDRSNSELSSGRSRSRTGRYRDEDSLGPPVEAQPELSPRIPHRFQMPTDLKQSQTTAMENPTPPHSAKLPTIHKAKSGYFDAQSLRPIQTRHDNRSGPSSEANSPMLPTPSSARPTPTATSLPHSPPDSASSTPPSSALPTPNTMPGPVSFSRSAMPNRKRSVQKSEISEPVLISFTGNFDTVDLPPGASLKNGQEPSSAPPVPPMNPLRRRTQKLFSNALGRSDSAPEVPTLPNSMSPHEMLRTNSSPEEDERSWSRQRGRNASGNRDARNRRAVSPPPSPRNQFKPGPTPMQGRTRAGAPEGAMF
ncbi:MAG: hypothetical protein M1821_001347 [Bathelium mastoideum]|nr:MAG: hypothetical protein M1821_001347 [Bathelium mastoideum]